MSAGGELAADRAALELLGCEAAELQSHASSLRSFVEHAGDAGVDRWREIDVPTGNGSRRLRCSVAKSGGGGGHRLALVDSGEFDAVVGHVRQSSLWRCFATLLPVLTHGLRAPLNGIVVNLELLKELSKAKADDPLAAGRRQRSIEALDRSVTGLRQVLDSLIANLTEPCDEAVGPVQLQSVVDEVVALIKPQATVQRTQLVLSSSAPISVDGMRSQLKHALTNLVLTAVETSPPQGEVSVALEQNGNEAVVSVSEGGNVNGDVARRFAEERLGPEVDGPGVRLFVARAIAEAHGGALLLESKSDGGTRMELRLPAVLKGGNTDVTRTLG